MLKQMSWLPQRSDNMPPRIKKHNASDYIKKAGEIRRSQTVSTYGSGALVDFPRLSGIMAGIDYW